MTCLDMALGLKTEKLQIPEGLTPTRPDRGWIISPFHPLNPKWTCIVAAIPALICSILISMNNQITILALCRKERKLKKGAGFHLDLFLVTLLVALNSVVGFPFFNAAILLSIAHLEALKIEEEPDAPGAAPKFIGYNEQRISAILVSLLLGASVFLTPLLKNIPMPVLYGVFMYMGVNSVGKLQLTQRCLLFFMPKKYMPDHMYLRKVKIYRIYRQAHNVVKEKLFVALQVPLKRVHLFTLAQFATCLTLWLLKCWTETALLFPVILIAMVLTRKLLDEGFTQEQLRYLDDLLPNTLRKRTAEEQTVSTKRLPATVRRKIMEF